MTAKRKSKLKELTGKSNENGGSSTDDHEDSAGFSFLKRTIYNPMLEGVRWTERYSDSIEKFWLKLPDFVTTFIATLAVFTFGSTLRGEWVIILVTALRQWSGKYNETTDFNATVTDLFSPQNLKMENWLQFWFGAVAISYLIYFTVGGFLHWYFYVNRRHQASEWKLQPKKWLSPELEMHEIMVGSLALLITGTYSATLACYIYNGNPSTIYYRFDEYGWAWFFLQFAVIFLYQDYTTYILHRMYHTPFLYKNFHKLHHKYKQPTAFSVTAIHPVEIMHVQLTMCLPLFVVPVHWLPFYIVAIYTYYHGIIDHSGINFKAQWWQPWQPDAEFHDKHHEFFHVNFGFNIKIWDWLHGTDMKKNRKYTEETFFALDDPAISNESAKKTEDKIKIKKSKSK
ncbi:lathosterol oxidase-like [Arctopsyche grandis]|uniref:lathosterol oxidase-like n=1 Tax=Arctopsyche grandis TaxID=121162 RepID=UPI00406D8022